MSRLNSPASSSQQSSLHAHDTSKDPNTNMRSPQLYALYKQATQDPPIDKAANPGTFDFKVSPATPLYKIVSRACRAQSCLSCHNQGKAKKRAWQKIVDEGVTPTEAEEKYVELVETLKAKYGYDADKVPEQVGG